MKITKTKAALLTATVLAGTQATPALAQSSDEASGNDIIVTAQRLEERLQDVPISITVLDEEALANNNITNARDIASVTPGLTINSRYGNDATTFTIRGFTQELRTTSTVGVYFAEVVAPRGSGVNQGGDGSGPGNLFDLQNVQVLKGPQGTLFGRNTSGGAVLLVPVKPKDEFEGYVEASAGKLDLQRLQAVVNVPLGEGFKVRVGVDRNTRDGYLKNVSPFGPKRMGNVDYWAGRLSLLANLTDTLENYTIATYSKSDGSGAIPAVKDCAPGVSFAGIPVGDQSCAQIAREAPSGFWTVGNVNPDTRSRSSQWQVINTTTWEASDNLRVKNIFSYGEYLANNSIDLFGNFLLNPGVSFDNVTSPSQVNTFVAVTADPTYNHTNAQSSLVWEFQLQGTAADDRLSLQAGLYYERNNPIGGNSILTPQFTPCASVRDFECSAGTPGVALGIASYSNYENTFEGKAAYAQATYDFTEQLAFTAGIRYTKDKSWSQLDLGRIIFRPDGNHLYQCTNFTAPNFGTFTSYRNRLGYCTENLKNSSDAPTWTLGLDFKPTPDMLVYGKWTRGYRQGGISPASPATVQLYDPEQIDSYELGAKTSWRGAVPGYFNISGFYNDFQDQQLQVGVNCNPALPPFQTCTPTTTVANAGKSKLYGFESEVGVRPVDGLKIDVAYAYLKTKLQEYTPFVAPAGSPYNEPRDIIVGNPLPLSMPHKVTASAFYTLPLADSVGQISFGGTFIYESRYKVIQAAIEEDSYLPGYKYGNVNVNWENVAGMPIDLAFYVTNVTNTKRYAHKNDQFSRGFNSYFLHEPRLWGVRVKYRFGGLAD
ncbi:MAG: TonB-dependent receptor [Sphingomonadaceae bacterium]